MVAGQRVGDCFGPQELRTRILEALGGLLWEDENGHSDDENCCLYNHLPSCSSFSSSSSSSCRRCRGCCS